MQLADSWGVIRDLLRNNFSFAEIKDVIGAAGLPVHKLSHLKQKFRGGASKGQLMDGIDDLYRELTISEQNRYISYCVQEITTRKPSCKEDLENILERVGWGLSDNEPYPLELQIDAELAELPETVQVGIKKCLRRFRDGDISGSMTSICGTVDTLTEDIYNNFDLGNHKEASYHERVANSISQFEQYYIESLIEEGMTDKEAQLLWNNHKKAVSQSGYVLGGFRRNFSDTHGEQKIFQKRLLQRAIDCAIFIIRSIITLK